MDKIKAWLQRHITGPMRPLEFPEQTTVLAKDQPEYQPLPVYISDTREHNMICCWRLTWLDRLRVLFTGRLWVSQWTFGHLYPPVMPSVRSPFTPVRNRWPWLPRWLKNEMGHRRGLSACLRCNDSWLWKANHVTSYFGGLYDDDQRGCFPLCEECWRELKTPDARLPFYSDLIMEWSRNGPAASDRTRAAILLAVQAGR